MGKPASRDYTANMNGRKRASEATRHRLFEGILLRLARLPDADRLVLRGGMLMRHWFRPVPRLANDLDLVCTAPFGVEETGRQFRQLLANRDVEDGVTFDTKRFRVDGIWLQTDFPGVRIFAAGKVDGEEDQFTVDVTFGEPMVPPPKLGDYPTLSRCSARIWMCRPETITGRKLHALLQMGMLRWRPKDLNDLRLLLDRVPMDEGDLSEAIAASFASRGNTMAEARAIFGPDSWWGMKTSAVRWQEYVKESRRKDLPPDLGSVVAKVAERLNPILERQP
jgi:hypothetical protein